MFLRSKAATLLSRTIQVQAQDERDAADEAERIASRIAEPSNLASVNGTPLRVVRPLPRRTRESVNAEES
jgi:hypothetical protein